MSGGFSVRSGDAVVVKRREPLPTIRSYTTKAT
jgi:hypothetical protein